MILRSRTICALPPEDRCQGCDGVFAHHNCEIERPIELLHRRIDRLEQDATVLQAMIEESIQQSRRRVARP